MGRLLKGCANFSGSKMIIFKGYYLPGFTEGERNSEKEAKLSEYDEKFGGYVLSNEFGIFLKSSISLLVDGSEMENEPRNLIVGSCLKYNCMSEIWWMILREGEHPWSIYAGAWNEKLGVMVFEDQDLSVPSVWISGDPISMRNALNFLL